MASKYWYQAEVSHNGLNKYRVVKAATQYELNQKVATLQAQWDEQWEKRCEVEKKRREKEQILRNHEESLAFANEMTRDAERIQADMDSILLKSLQPKPLDINKMKDFSEYPVQPPQRPKAITLPREPQQIDAIYNPKIPFFTKISNKKTEDFRKQVEVKFNSDHASWELCKNKLEMQYEKDNNEYNKNFEQWQIECDSFKKKQSENNEVIDDFIRKYIDGDGEAIIKYYAMLINEIEMPFEYDRQIEAEYSSENQMLIMDLLLPTIEDIPKLKKVAYIKSQGNYKESYYPESYLKNKYETVIYQIVLQTLNYILKLDEGHDFIKAIVLNGKVSTIDKATGKNIEPYVLSINISKKDFNELNLSGIDPKAWFKSAKGVSASAIANITPVAPVVLMNREDNRFIDSYGVVDNLDDSINLAAIDWQDFENLIREIFEQEFNSNGGEVKITQASRDGGVDAVAFDPDPIRGGKIVIQAKRYTNVVGVSAVRDLYGTVMNEGATKGILVTTSNYGNDAYEFAKGKPLTLMNGANLLYLLEKHGHQARIDLKEAKEILNSEK
jgi:restriction system protein